MCVVNEFQHITIHSIQLMKKYTMLRPESLVLIRDENQGLYNMNYLTYSIFLITLIPTMSVATVLYVYGCSSA